MFENLKSNAQYELKVFIKTHIGYSVEHFLSINFTTKSESKYKILIFITDIVNISSTKDGLRIVANPLIFLNEFVREYIMY